MSFNFSLGDFLQLIAAMVIALGGPTLIILGLSKWFGEYLSDRLLTSVKNKHGRALESLKNDYQKELETKKSELEKARSQFFRYSEKQFELYNDLWRVLMRTKIMADDLWLDAKPEAIPSFAEQISLTRQAVMDNLLLIEESHYKSLDSLLTNFEQFKFGKLKLVEMRSNEEVGQATQATQATQAQVKSTISQNATVKKKYTDLIMKIGKSLRKQIKG